VSCCVGAHQTLLREFLFQHDLLSLYQVLIPTVYYLPVWFQAVKGNSAVASGIHLLPQVIALVIASIVTGILTTKIGYYTPFLIVGVCFAAIGAGLLTTLNNNTTTGQWIGYQIVYGFGYGGCVMAPNMAAQTVLPRDEVSIGASLMLFGQTLFGAIFVSVGQNVLDGQLANRLAGITNITPQQIENAGLTGLLQIIPSQYHDAALGAYNESLRICFRVGLVMACLAIIGALLMEWRNVKTEKDRATRNDVEVEQGTTLGKTRAASTHSTRKKSKEASDFADVNLGTNV
jgi:MFS family permease